MPLWLREWLRSVLLVLAALGVAAGVFGTPHVGWDYVCRHRLYGQPCRIFEWCEYYGFQGRRVIYPEYGDSCGVVRLLPIDWRALWAG